MSDETPIRVVIVDDHALIRSGLKAEIQATAPHVQIVAEASGVAEAVAAITQHRPGVVLLDIHMPDGGGVAVLQQCRELLGSTHFLALSVSDSATDVIAAVRAGARGYVTKSITTPELIEAMQRVSTGDAVFGPKLAGFVLDAFVGAPATEEEDELDRLTAREKEVMHLLARGYTYRDIAAELFVSIKTVESHASAVLRKLQMSSRHELTLWATSRDLLR